MYVHMHVTSLLTTAQHMRARAYLWYYVIVALHLMISACRAHAYAAGMYRNNINKWQILLNVVLTILTYLVICTSQCRCAVV
jgi:phosphatidylglycerophosphate synthase